jgi:exopolysaccharide production protein ExoY
MAGNLIVGSHCVPNPGYAREGLDISGLSTGIRLAAVATLLTRTADILYSPGNKEASPDRQQAELEEISLAVHELRTNGIHYRLIKRLLDIIIVCALLPCLLPLLLVAALLVRISSPGPIFYSQRRIGRFGREFRLWKFRSMYVDGEHILRKHLQENPGAAREWEQTRKLRVDPRVTRLGRVLRRTSIDELPQFFNVLAGSMSLVGPRPIVLAERINYREAYFFYASAKPGLTGLWQVSGRSDVSYHQRVKLDEEYVRGWRLTLDLSILWRTAGVVWGAKGAV